METVAGRTLQKTNSSKSNTMAGGSEQLHARPERWSSQLHRQMEWNTCESFWDLVRRERLGFSDQR